MSGKQFTKLLNEFFEVEYNFFQSCQQVANVLNSLIPKARNVEDKLLLTQAHYAYNRIGFLYFAKYNGKTLSANLLPDGTLSDDDILQHLAAIHNKYSNRSGALASTNLAAYFWISLNFTALCDLVNRLEKSEDEVAIISESLIKPIQQSPRLKMLFDEFTKEAKKRLEASKDDKELEHAAILAKKMSGYCTYLNTYLEIYEVVKRDPAVNELFSFESLEKFITASALQNTTAIKSSQMPVFTPAETTENPEEEAATANEKAENMNSEEAKALLMTMSGGFWGVMEEENSTAEASDEDELSPTLDILFHQINRAITLLQLEDLYDKQVKNTREDFNRHFEALILAVRAFYLQAFKENLQVLSTGNSLLSILTMVGDRLSTFKNHLVEAFKDEDNRPHFTLGMSLTEIKKQFFVLADRADDDRIKNDKGTLTIEKRTRPKAEQPVVSASTSGPNVSTSSSSSRVTVETPSSAEIQMEPLPEEDELEIGKGKEKVVEEDASEQPQEDITKDKGKEQEVEVKEVVVEADAAIDEQPQDEVTPEAINATPEATAIKEKIQAINQYLTERALKSRGGFLGLFRWSTKDYDARRNDWLELLKRINENRNHHTAVVDHYLRISIFKFDKWGFSNEYATKLKELKTAIDGCQGNLSESLPPAEEIDTSIRLYHLQNKYMSRIDNCFKHSFWPTAAEINASDKAINTRKKYIQKVQGKEEFLSPDALLKVALKRH